MSNNFCRRLSNGYKINVQGDDLLWSPCCYYQKKIKLSDRQALQKEMDYTSSATSWLPECKDCRFMETTGATHLSPRLASFRHIPDDVPDGDCVELELSFDDNCNAACIMCCSQFSTTWKKYEYKHRLHDHGIVEDRSAEMLQRLIDTVPFNHLRRLFILGGEPFFGPANLRILEHVEKVHPDLSLIDLQYQSNGSLFPEPIVIEKWKKYKRVVLGLSIDELGDKFEYIRWPLKWDKIEACMKKFISETDVLFSINATMNPLTILDFEDIVSWARNIFPRDRLSWPDDPVRLNLCYPPMDLFLTPIKLRAACENKFGPGHAVTRVLRRLPPSNEQGIREMFSYIEKHDALRKLDWRETFPEMVQYYQDILG